MRIGLLEDNPAIQDYVQKALELNGHHVSIYTFGTSLLETLFAGKPLPASLPFDLVIIDLHLPGELSGWDVVLHIRKTFPSDALPIIIMSGTERYQLEQLDALFPDISFIQKPFKLDILLQLLDASQKKQRKVVK